MQCQNGHLLCVNCRIRAENCPVCRDRYYPRPALIAEQLQAAITSAFNLCRSEDKVRQKIFGRHHRQQMARTSLEYLTRTEKVHKSSKETTTLTLPDNEILPKTTLAIASSTANNRCDECSRRHVADKRVHKRINPTTVCNKLLTKLLNYKTHSTENLTNASSSSMATSCSKTICSTTLTTPSETKNTVLSHSPVSAKIDTEVYERQEQIESTPIHHEYKEDTRNTTNQLDDDFKATKAVRPMQLLSMTVATAIAKRIVNSDLSINSNPHCCKQMSSNQIEHFSLSSSDLTVNNKATAAEIMSPTNVHIAFETLQSSGTASSISLSTNIARNNIPVVLSKRPCSVLRDNRSQSIPRALKLPTNDFEEYQNSLTNSNLDNLSFETNDHDSETFNLATPSTVSLKSSTSSSSISHLDLASKLHTLQALANVNPMM